MNLKFYVSGETQVCLFHEIPICRLNEVKALMKQAKVKYRIRYRGSRKNDGRYSDQQQRDCLRKNATHFAVYSTANLPYYDDDGYYYANTLKEYCQYIKTHEFKKLGLI